MGAESIVCGVDFRLLFSELEFWSGFIIMKYNGLIFNFPFKYPDFKLS